MPTNNASANATFLMSISVVPRHPFLFDVA
jgi:hypothetical protein